MARAWIYIMSNRPDDTLYIGVTNDLARRIGEHQSATGSAFTSRYGLNRLVYSEEHTNTASAIQRETSLKRWPRTWKVRLIHLGNPEWNDLSSDL
ncbi:MAG: GIY-YIG nuclease family protein [Rhodopila sp.]